jgi:hypothetical protein
MVTVIASVAGAVQEEDKVDTDIAAGISALVVSIVSDRGGIGMLGACLPLRTGGVPASVERSDCSTTMSPQVTLPSPASPSCP